MRNWRWEAPLGRDSTHRAAENEQNFAILAPRALKWRFRLDEITGSAARDINPLQMTCRTADGKCQRTPIRGPEWMYRSLGAGESAGFDAIDGA